MGFGEVVTLGEDDADHEDALAGDSLTQGGVVLDNDDLGGCRRIVLGVSFGSLAPPATSLDLGLVGLGIVGLGLGVVGLGIDDVILGFNDDGDLPRRCCHLRDEVGAVGREGLGIGRVVAGVTREGAALGVAARTGAASEGEGDHEDHQSHGAKREFHGVLLAV